jgi:hypothetical protein
LRIGEAGVTPGNRKINWYETCLSLGILLVLTLIGSVVFKQQYEFNPAIIQSPNIRSVGPGKVQPAPAGSVKALIQLEQSILPLTPQETFTPDNLSDKINGKAELYLSAGFNRLDSQRFTDRRNPDRWMEIFIYDMGNSENAFAVYSGQQRDDAAPIDLGPLSYATGNALYLAHGPYYIEFIGSEAASEMLQAMRKMLELYINDTPVESAPIAGKNIFPAKGLDPDSITLIPTDAFGYSGFNQIFTAEYNLSNNELTAFVSRRESPEDAVRLAEGYYRFLLRFGGKDASIDNKLMPEKAFMIEILDSYEVFFTYGNYIAGVHEAADPAEALELIGALTGHLKDGSRGE